MTGPTMHPRTLYGRLGRHSATLRRADASTLVLRFRGHEFDLLESRVDHLVDGRRATFTVSDSGGRAVDATYRWRNRSPASMAMDYLDFTAEEPWTWEDGDFGERVFHVATGTGPLKYRHRLCIPDEPAAELPDRRVQFEDGRLTQVGVSCGLRFERSAALADVSRVSIKFEIAGVWSEPSLLVVRAPDAVLTADLASPSAGGAAAVGACQQLPGWDSSADAAIADAIDYAVVLMSGASTREDPHHRRETVIWTRAS